MDTSEKYIKMCDCPEIHGKSVTPPSPADYYAQRKRSATRYGYQLITADIVDDDYIWLPRQDQIQEMLIKEKFGDFDANWDICVEIPIQFVAKNPTLELSSMEQIWLSCYMLSIHQKKWDGEKWTK